MRARILLMGLACVMGGCSASQTSLPGPTISAATENAVAAKRSAITVGNGEANWIITAGATRDGTTFVFPEVQINGNGWLVLHPFAEGKPNGDIYVGATYVSSGNNNNVAVSINAEPTSGDMFLVMLHRDVDEDQQFDFVFVGDTGQVEDKAVFEGNTMIGHPYAAP